MRTAVLACCLAAAHGGLFDKDFNLASLFNGKASGDEGFVKVPISKDIPAHYQIVFETDVKVDGKAGVFKANVTTDWSPLGAERLYRMVKANVLDGTPFHRVVPDFIVQFGIPTVGPAAVEFERALLDDRVVKSNEKWTLTFAHAGPDTRTTQLFVNMNTNTHLDKDGFSPLATIVEGQEVLRLVFNPTPGESEGMDQMSVREGGSRWVRKHFPEANTITRAYIAA